MLTRSSQVGEFYIMSPPQIKPKGDGEHTCDIMIFDEERDSHVRVSWNEAVEASLCSAKLANDGSLDGQTASAFLTEHGAKPLTTGSTKTKKTFNDWAEAAAAWSAFNASEKGNYASTVEKYGKDVRIIVARPFIEHLMHSVVMAVSGRDTGATLFGPAECATCESNPHPLPTRTLTFGSVVPRSMQLSANTQVKTIEGHYTGHFKAVITKPRSLDASNHATRTPAPACSPCSPHLACLCVENVLIMRDVACAGYVAGGNATFFTKGANGYTTSSGREHIQERLSFAEDVGAKYGSMLAFPCSEQQFSANQGLDTVMSVTSRLLPWEVTGVNARNHSSFPGGEAVFQAYNTELGLDSVHYGEDMKAAGLPRRLKPCPLATPADRPLACAPLQRTRILFPKDLLTTPRERTPHAPRSRSRSRAHTLPRAQVLHRPAPEVRPVHFQLHVVGARPGPVRCRTQTRRPSPLRLSTHALTARSPLVCAASAPTPSRATRAGAAASPSASRRPATRATPALKFAHVPCHATMKPLIQFSTPPRMVPLELAQCVGTSNHNPNHHPRSLFSLRTPQARPDGLPGALNALARPNNAGLRDQEARRILAAVGGTIASGRVCVRVRPPGECVHFYKKTLPKTR